MVIETALVFGLGWLLGKGGPLGKPSSSSSPSSGPKPKDATAPSKVPWPVAKTETLPPVPVPTAAPLTPDDKAAIAASEAQHGAETTKFQAQVAEARAKAGSDAAAQQDISRRARERQKALDDWKRDIEAAKR